MKLLCFACSVALACPRFVEFFPDPLDVSDQEGEFVEIRLDSSFSTDSIYVQLDDKKSLAFAYPAENRVVLSHGKKICLDKVTCEDLGGISIPNSREMVWRLVAGSCKDSVYLDKPKGGKSFQRVGDSDKWILTNATPGYAHVDYELDIDDCGFSQLKIQQVDNFWMVKGTLEGCEKSKIYMDYLKDPSRGIWAQDSMDVGKYFSAEIPVEGVSFLRLLLPPDAVPNNNELDTLLATRENSPLAITEVHHCPTEPVPEWVEVYNKSRVKLPLSKVKFCDRGNAWGNPEDSIAPYEAVLVTKDTTLLREQIGFQDVRIVYAAMGYLKNTGGSLALCYENLMLDSVSWDKQTVDCPLGFNPLTQKPENTPGYLGSKKSVPIGEPFDFKLSSRILQRRGSPLRIYVYGEVEVNLKLMDSTGRFVWKEKVPPKSNEWWNVPVQEYVRIGVAYISLTAGAYEKVIGIVVRP